MIDSGKERVEIAIKVQEACPFLKLLRVDVAISSTRCILNEVNPSMDLLFQEQTAVRLLKGKRTHDEFVKYNLLISKCQ